ncbi:conserved hypothetical protein [Candidatus Magnetomoraceae bacterium gMMP-15]
MNNDGYLVVENGYIFLGDVQLSGILKDMSISSKVRFDTAKIDGISGQNKTPQGWTDADITINLELLSDSDSDCYYKLTEINDIFKGADNGVNPKIYQIHNSHTFSRQIQQVIFSELSSQETNQDDVITVSLKFIEYNPIIVDSEKKVVASDESKKTEAPTINTEEKSPEIDENIIKTDEKP